MKLSVIIPAYNEENVISRCLNNIFLYDYEYNIEVIVVCNGCTDNTAARAREYAPRVNVVETEISSKSNALNIGDRYAHYFPRFYIDADILVKTDAIVTVAEVLKSGRALAAAPEMHIDLTGTSYLVKKYYGVWTQLPYAHEGMIGSGIYGVSFNGRKKFCEFPNIMADDAYIRLQYNTEERKTVRQVKFLVFAPKNIATLISIKTRVKLGGIELKRKFPELKKNEGKSNTTAIFKNILKGNNLVFYLVYIMLSCIIMVNAKFRYIFGINYWSRDNTTR